MKKKYCRIGRAGMPTVVEATFQGGVTTVIRCSIIVAGVFRRNFLPAASSRGEFYAQLAHGEISPIKSTYYRSVLLDTFLEN